MEAVAGVGKRGPGLGGIPRLAQFVGAAIGRPKVLVQAVENYGMEAAG